MSEDVIEGIGHEDIGKHTSLTEFYCSQILLPPKMTKFQCKLVLFFVWVLNFFFFINCCRSFVIWTLLEEDGQLYNIEKMEVWIFRKAGKNTKW